MKRKFFTVYFIITFILFNCISKPTGINKLIIDFEELSGTTKTDLNIKILNLEKLKGISIRDSLRIIQFQLTKAFYPEARYIDSSLKFNETIILSDKMISILEKSMKIPDMQFISNSKEKYHEWFQRKYKIMNLQNLESIYENKDTSTVLVNMFKCTFTIKNPFLNGVKQELTHVYLINNSLTSIIKREDL